MSTSEHHDSPERWQRQVVCLRSSQMKSVFIRFVREEAGQDLIEYGLLVGIITVGAVASIKLIGPKVTQYFGDLVTALG